MAASWMNADGVFEGAVFMIADTITPLKMVTLIAKQDNCDNSKF